MSSVSVIKIKMHCESMVRFTISPAQTRKLLNSPCRQCLLHCTIRNRTTASTRTGGSAFFLCLRWPEILAPVHINNFLFHVSLPPAGDSRRSISCAYVHTPDQGFVQLNGFAAARADRINLVPNDQNFVEWNPKDQTSCSTVFWWARLRCLSFHCSSPAHRIERIAMRRNLAPIALAIIPALN